MPLVLTNCEELAMVIGEAIHGDVECWETEPAETGANLIITRGGKDYRVRVVERTEAE